VVRNPHHEPYKKEIQRRRGSNFKNNADMLHVMEGKKNISRFRKYNETLVLKSQNSIKSKVLETLNYRESDVSIDDDTSKIGL
jgi:hypothetical protein